MMSWLMLGVVPWLVLLSGCFGGEDQSSTQSISSDGDQNGRPSQFQTLTATYEKDHRAYRNPGKGWVPYSFVEGKGNPQVTRTIDYDTPIASTLHVQLTWGELEPMEGQYKWAHIDRFIEVFGPKGRKLRLQIMVANSKSDYGVSVPNWYCTTQGNLSDHMDCNNHGFWQNGCIKYQADNLTCAADGTRWAFEPDYRSDRFRSKFSAFLKAFGDRYGADTSGRLTDWRRYVESLEISGYGDFGEWWSTYSWLNATPEGTNLPTKYETLKEIANEYLDLKSRFPEFLDVKMNVVGGGLPKSAGQTRPGRVTFLAPPVG